MLAGVIVSIVGYVAATVGTGVLFFATPKEFLRALGMYEQAQKCRLAIRANIEGIERRQRFSKLGFGILLVGTILQMVGTYVAASR